MAITFIDEQPERKLVLDESPVQSPLPPHQAENKAKKIDFVLGEGSPGTESIKQGLNNGLDEYYNNMLRNNKQLEFMKQKNAMVKDLIDSSDGPVSQEEVDFINGLTQVDAAELANTPNIMETEYAKKFMRTALENDQREVFVKNERYAPEEVNSILDNFEEYAAKNQIVNTFLDQNERETKDQGLWDTVLDWGELLVNPLANFNLNSAAIDTKGILPGNSLREQYNYLATLSRDEFNIVVNQAYETIKADNLMEARRFLEGMKIYSETDEFVDNIFGAAAIGEVVGLIAGAGRGVRALKNAAKESVERPTAQLRETLKAAMVEASENVPDIERAANRMGNFKVAAVTNAVKKFSPSELGKAVREIPGGSQVLKNIPSAVNPRGFYQKVLGNRNTDRLERLMKSAEDADGLITRMLTKMDTPGQAESRVAALASRLWDSQIANRLTTLQNAILDVSVGQTKGTLYRVINEPISNTENIAVALGDGRGMLFDSAQTATQFAQNYTDGGLIDDFRIRAQGSGYYIEAKFPIPESADLYRDIPLPKSSQTKGGLLRSVFGLVGSSKGTLSADNSIARLQVTHGQQKFAELYQELATPIARLNKEELDELDTIWRHNRDAVREVNGEEVRGFWYETAYELEEAFQSRYGHLPTDNQLDAYRAYRQLNDTDFLIRSASWYKDKLRAGISKWEDSIGDQTGARTPFRFEGKEISKTDIKLSNDKPVVIARKEGDNFTYYDTRNVQQLSQIDEIIKNLDQNEIIIQVADANLKIPGRERSPLGVGFYITKRGEAKKSAITMVDKYRAGGHVVQRHNFYIKQGRIEEDGIGKALTGDNVIAGAPTQAEAAKRAKYFEDARQMLAAGVDKNVLEQFTAKHLGLSAEDFLLLFTDKVDKNGNIIKKGLRVDIPFVSVKSGQRTSDVMQYDKDVMDLTKSDYNLLEEMNRKFAGERDNKNLWVYDEESDITVNLNREGELLDPSETLRSAAKNVLDLRFKKDYTLMSADNWLKEYSDLLEGDVDKLFKSPMETLYNPTFKRTADQERLRMAKQVRQHVLSFVGGKNQEETMFEVGKQKLRDIAYGKWGKNGLKVVDNYAIPLVDDPLTALRSIAFHAKLGLFNWHQVLVQAQAMVSLTALSPKMASYGWTAMPLMQSMRVAPRHAEKIAEIAAQFGWKKDEFLEMYEAFDNSGWGIVKGSASVLDDLSNPPIFRSALGKTLDAGTVFFETGEKMSRYAAYSTAYSEWKLANKGKALDKVGRKWILDRADDLTINMSAANNAVWQRGVLGIPLQFFSYQARLTEAYLGKKLSPKDKAKLFAVQAGMYGLPTATGGAIGVWPVYESVKAMLVENNIDYNDNAIVQILTQGMPATMASLAGLEADYAQRFGSGGMPTLREWINGEKGFGEIAVGASGSVFGDILTSGGGVISGLAATISGDKRFYDFVADDVVAASRNISSINNSLRIWTAYQTGQWLTKSGTFVDDVSLGEAIYMGLTGDQLDRIADNYTKIELLSQRKEYVKEISKLAGDLYKRGITEKDPGIRAEYLKKAWGTAQAGGLDTSEYSSAVRRAMQSLTESQLDTVQKSFEEDVLRAKERISNGSL